MRRRLFDVQPAALRVGPVCGVAAQSGRVSRARRNPPSLPRKDRRGAEAWNEATDCHCGGRACNRLSDSVQTLVNLLDCLVTLVVFLRFDIFSHSTRLATWVVMNRTPRKRLSYEGLRGVCSGLNYRGCTRWATCGKVSSPLPGASFVRCSTQWGCSF